MSLIKLTMREVSVDLFCMVQSEQSRKIKLSYELVTFILRRSILIHYELIYTEYLLYFVQIKITQLCKVYFYREYFQSIVKITYVFFFKNLIESNVRDVLIRDFYKYIIKFQLFCLLLVIVVIPYRCEFN